jgi:murein DD-endopeptidase MepM/ murein hydrolase activator NlpD
LVEYDAEEENMSPVAVPKPAAPGVAKTAIAETSGAFVNLRNGPGTQYDDIGDIRNQSLLVYYPATKRTDGWVYVEQYGAAGWVSTSVIKFQDVVADPNRPKTPTPYDGKVAVWHWKGQGIPEATIEDLVKTFKRVMPNVKQIWVKTSDGASWQGQFDRSAMAINGPQSVDQWVQVLERNGLEFHAWCVVLGKDVQGEANIISQVCARPGVKSMIMDVEPYDGYFEASKDVIRPMMTQIRKAIPSSFHIGMGVDPRRGHFNSIYPQEWFPFINSIHPMVYWKTFRRDPDDVLSETYTVWGNYGRPIIPILQGDAEITEQQTALTLSIAKYGAPGVSWWRYGEIAKFSVVNTPITVTAPTQPIPIPTDQYGDEQVIRPNDPGYRSGSYTGQPEFQSFVGTWGWTVYYKATEAQGSKVWAEWKANLPVSGSYQISVFVPARHATTLRARYKIHGIKGTNTEVVVDINQSRYKNEWVSLGIFELQKDALNAGRVFLNDLTGETGLEIAFDAMRWRRIVQTTPPPIPDTTTPGTPLPEQIDGVYIADGYDAPVGTAEQRKGTTVWPKDAKGWADASPYGILYFKGTSREAYHTGADLNWGSPTEDKGLPTYACASGVVIFAARLPVWGNVIIIRHDPLKSPTGKVLYSRYGHIQNMKVQVGQRVKRGDQVAEIGDAFGTLVPHLHFDLSPSTILENRPQDWPGKDLSRIQKDYVDPKKFITSNRP